MSNTNLQVCFINDSKTTAKPNEPSIAWRNLNYAVQEFSNGWWRRKTILQPLSGQFAAGTLNAIAGPSGAGKSTLLNILSGSTSLDNRSTSTAELYLNTAPGESIVSYYVRQHVHESIPGQLTVGQILRYAYRFKNRTVFGREERMEKHIEQTMAELMLPNEVQGRLFSKCSGGQQRRVAILQELMALTPPSFLFLDEPTTGQLTLFETLLVIRISLFTFFYPSGLDSVSAFETMKCLKNLAKSHQMTIICSIHTPNDETLKLFDQLYVLAKGGLCVYDGSPDAIRETLESKLNIKIAHQQPPIENLLKIACQGVQDESVIELSKRVNRKIKSIRRFSHLHRHQSGFPRPRQIFSFIHLYLQMSRFTRLLLFSNRRQIAFSYILFFIIFSLFSTIYNHQMSTANVCYPKVNQTQSSDGNVTCSKNDYEQNQLANMNNTFHGYTLLLVGFIVMCTSAIVFSPLVKMFENEHPNRKCPVQRTLKKFNTLPHAFHRMV